MLRRTSLILVFSSTLLFFQNCGKVAAPSDGSASDNQKSETVIDSASRFKKISYDPAGAYGAAKLHLDLSLDSGALTADVDGISYSCALDSARLAEAREIIAASNICQPGPLPPGTAVCMAASIPDVLLSNDADSVQLQPVVCHFGTFLCDGNDARLRALLTDLRENLPANCSAN
jgi:hypothetical protein